MVVVLQAKVHECRPGLRPRLYAGPVCRDGTNEVACAATSNVNCLYIVHHPTMRQLCCCINKPDLYVLPKQLTMLLHVMHHHRQSSTLDL